MSENPASAPANDDEPAASPGRPLTPEARRALAEAQERRARENPVSVPTELDGRGGLDPARYGDWEVKGIVSDF